MIVLPRFLVVLLCVFLLGLMLSCSLLPADSKDQPSETEPLETDTQAPYTLTPRPSTDTPIPPTATPTNPPSPTSLAYELRENVYLYDPFDDTTYNWYTGEYQDAFVASTRTIANGVFRWDVTALQPSRLTGVPEMDLLENFTLSVEGQRLSGPLDSGFALLFRRQDRSNAYFFIVRDNGEYAFMRLVNETWTPIIDYKPSPAYHSGEVNQLMVKAQDSRFEFFINDEHVDTAQDNTYPVGVAGLGVFLKKSGDEASYTFDNFEINAEGIVEAGAGAITPQAEACANGAPAGTWLLIVNSTSNQQITIDGTAFTVYAGRNEFYLSADDMHTIVAGGNTLAYIARECAENTLNIQ